MTRVISILKKIRFIVLGGMIVFLAGMVIGLIISSNKWSISLSNCSNKQKD